ncbi:MAG: hypothetical protein LBR85_01105 [Oscillospiraceae bacterium]|jgi:hypothetical protein|nr:hypothetical protein [Oscillospiraceae bacterium]
MHRIKTFMTRPVALMLCLVLLGGSVAAAALNASPYEMLKNAVFDLLTAESAAVDIDMRMLVNGELRTHETSHREFSPSAQYTRTSHTSAADDFSIFSVSFDSGGLSIFNTINLNHTYLDASGKAHRVPPYCAVRRDEDYASEGGLLGTDTALNRGDIYVRFAELLLDTAVGSLKNNISVRDAADGVKELSGTVTAQQIPEIYNAAASVFAMSQSTGAYRYISNEMVGDDGKYQTWRTITFNESSFTKTVTVTRQSYEKVFTDPETGAELPAGDPRIDQDNYHIMYGDEEQVSQREEPLEPADFGEDKLAHPMKSARIDYASGDASLDSDGRFINASFTGRIICETVFGEIVEIEVIADGSANGINSTEPQCPIPGAQELFTEEYFESVIGENYSLFRALYFDTLPDGSVDPDSVVFDYADFFSSYIDPRLLD